MDMVGVGPREMATLDVNDSYETAKQIALEMNISSSQELEEALVEWIQESREPARLAMRLEGVLASDIEWERLAKRRRFGRSFRICGRSGSGKSLRLALLPI